MAYSGVVVHLILFAHHKLDSAPLFLCSEAENVVKKKGVPYHVDYCAAKAAKFFLMCKSHIKPDMRIKIPAVMMAKGYSDEESKNRTLQMQVRQDVEKFRGLDPPRPPEAKCRGCDGPVDSFSPPECDESHFCNDYSQCSPCFG
jgi:hypothetical protein